MVIPWFTTLLQTVIGILQGLNNWQLHGGAPPSRVPPKLDSPEVQHGTFKKITRFFQKLDKTSSKSPFQVFHAFVFGYINIYFITKIHVEGGHWPRARRIFPPQILVSWRINEPSVPSGEPGDPFIFWPTNVYLLGTCEYCPRKAPFFEEHFDGFCCKIALRWEKFLQDFFQWVWMHGILARFQQSSALPCQWLGSLKKNWAASDQCKFSWWTSMTWEKQLIVSSLSLTKIWKVQKLDENNSGQSPRLFQGNPGWWNIIIWPDVYLGFLVVWRVNSREFSLPGVWNTSFKAQWSRTNNCDCFNFG